MTHTLAVITPQLGAVSETFVRRHVEDIAPGRTVAVALRSLGAKERWAPPRASLFLDREERRPLARLAQLAGADVRAAAVRRFLRRNRVTVVLGEYLNDFIEFAPLMRTPYVVQGHGIDVSAALRDPVLAKRYLAYASARAVLTRCEFHRRRLIDLGLPAQIVHVNPGGVDIPAALPARGPDAAKRFLAIGRMTPKKGPIFLLEAFRQAAAEDPDVTLDYIGGGGLAPAVRQFVEACGLGERVRLHGSASEETKQALLETCGVFVQHSLTDPDTGDEEGLPAAIQEAMAQGMAVVSTRHAGIPDAVEDGVTGRLAAEGDAGGMAQAMLRLARGEDSWEAFGAAGHTKAARLYSWNAERARLLGHLGISE